MASGMDDRTTRVLRFVVEDYIATAEPVGSRTISKKMGQALSPATIRNIMADLEEAGFLSQPHTSAGRVPTGAGFRYYIDHLLSPQTLARGEMDQLHRAAGEGNGPADELVRQVSRLLSNLAHQASVVVVSSPEQQLLRSVSLMRAGVERILLVAVMRGGWVQHRLIEGEPDLSGDELEKISAYLNELAEGRTLPQLRARILAELGKEKARYDRVMGRALTMGARALADAAPGEVFIEGRANILEQPEFAEDVDRLKRILRAFEEKSVIFRLLDRAMESRAIQVSVGLENTVEELPDISVVASGYRQGASAVGSIGLIGPVRMDYSRVIPLVEYAASLLTTMFEDR
jgi:heat-inducible transcriptional repressor